MSNKESRWRDEIRSIEKQLPLFNQKIAELEKRRSDLSSHLPDQEPKNNPGELATASIQNQQQYTYRYAELLPPRPSVIEVPAAKVQNNKETAPAESPSSFLSRENVIGILGETNQKLRTLHQVVNRAAVSMEFILFIINFLSQENPNLQQLMTIADAVRVQGLENNPGSDSKAGEAGVEQKAADTNQIKLTPETVSEIMRSPLFQQLAASLKPEASLEKPAE